MRGRLVQGSLLDSWFFIDKLLDSWFFVDKLLDSWFFVDKLLDSRLLGNWLVDECLIFSQAISLSWLSIDKILIGRMWLLWNDGVFRSHKRGLCTTLPPFLTLFAFLGRCPFFE